LRDERELMVGPVFRVSSLAVDRHPGQQICRTDPTIR